MSNRRRLKGPTRLRACPSCGHDTWGLRPGYGWACASCHTLATPAAIPRAR
jgi:hypothetical protein